MKACEIYSYIPTWQQSNIDIFAKLDELAVQKNQNWDDETTTWIFEDETSLTTNPQKEWVINLNDRFHCDNEKL